MAPKYALPAWYSLALLRPRTRSSDFPALSGTFRLTTTAPKFVIVTSMPCLLVSVYKSADCPSDSFPKSCFCIFESAPLLGSAFAPVAASKITAAPIAPMNCFLLCMILPTSSVCADCLAAAVLVRIVLRRVASKSNMLRMACGLLLERVSSPSKRFRSLYTVTLAHCQGIAACMLT